MTISIIEKDIPVPPRKRGRKPGSRKYPFAELGLGDSFFVKAKKVMSVYSTVSRANKAHAPKRFTARNIEGGVRVWRYV